MADDKRLERIEDKIDKIGDKQSEMSATLSAQHISLQEHMRRTALLETAIKPIVRKISMAEGALKLIGILAAIATIIEAIRLLVHV